MGGTRIGFLRYLLGVLLTVVSTVGLVGCVGPQVVTPPPPWWQPYLTIDQDLIALGLRDFRMSRSRTGSGFLRVVGEYANHSRATLSAIYRFTWIDESGQPVDSILSGWQAVHTLPKTTATFSGVAPRPDIREFRAELMAAHRLKGVPPPPEPDR